MNSNRPIHVAREMLAAALVCMSVTASGADRVVTLRTVAPVAKGIAAMLLIDAPANEAERRINAALPRFDANVRKAVAECRKGSGKNFDWSRSVEATMRGPGFLSFTIGDNAFCGGAHPNSATQAIVYDLATGKPVDWTTLLPSSLTGTLSLQAGMDDTKTVALASKKLFDIYLKLYRPVSAGGKETDEDRECREAVKMAGSDAPPPMSAWLDAKQGGLAVQFDLAHVVQACADAVIIPVAMLKAEGAKAALTDALEAASRAAK